MFVLTGHITLGNYKPLQPTSMVWRHNVGDYASTAAVTMPAISRLVTNGQVYNNVQTAQQLTEGMPVQIMAGYNGENEAVFSGFISRIGYGVPLQIDCEGYSYLLRKKTFTKSYASTTVRQLLEDLLAGTPITIHAKTASIGLPAVRFANVSGIEVLDYFKRNLLTVHFSGSVLYVGIEQLEVPGVVAYRLNWNTIGDEGLQFGPQPGSIVNISIEKRNAAGDKKQSKDSSPGVRRKRVSLNYTQEQLNALQARETEREAQKGFEGSITAFLQPWVGKSYTAVITDGRYPERNGRYFVEGVEGSISNAGGRQIVKIGGRLA